MRRFARLAAPLVALCLGGCATIYTAAARGSDAGVARRVAEGADPNKPSIEGATPLLLAVVNGHLSTVKRLLSLHADPNKPNAKGETPLAYAVQKNFSAIVEALIAGGAAVDGKYGSAGMTPLLLAAKNGDAAMIELLSSHGASAAAKSAGVSALVLALNAGRIEAVQALLRLGSDPNEPDRTGQTPVEYATYANRPDLVSALLAFGGKPIGVQGRVGLSLGTRKDGAVVVEMVARDSPAANAGIASGDLFLELNGETVAGWPAEKVAARLRGAAGTFVALTLRRGNGAPTPYTLARQAVGLETSAPPAAAVPASMRIVSDVDSAGETASPRNDDFALVIGIEDYQAVSKAAFGERDARAVRRHLEALGWPARNIVSLEGAAATDSKLKSYLQEWLPLNVKDDSTLFVYFAGHGAPDPVKGDAYLVPWDGDPRFLKSTAYQLKQFYADLASLKARRVLVALDACFSGAGGRSVLAQGARPLVVTAAADAPRSANLTVLAAAGGDEIAGTLEAQGHGLFTYYLLKGLSGEARNAQGEVTTQSLFDYLKPRVEDEAHRQNREQTPTIEGAASASPLATYASSK